MSTTIHLTNLKSGELRTTRLTVTGWDERWPIELEDLDQRTHYYYASFEQLSKEWDFPHEREII